MKSHVIILMGSLLAVAPILAHDCHGYNHHCCGDHDWSECGHHCCSGHDCAHRDRVGQYEGPTSAPIESLNGTVAEIRRPPTAKGVIEAWLKTAGSTILVRLGPDDFLTQNGLTLHEGEPITVKGFRAASSDGDLLIATEADVGGKSVLLRSGRGKPLW